LGSAFLAAWVLSYPGLLPVSAATLTLKLRAINPSQTETQRAPVKAYLPRPATPADVVNAGELVLAYDIASKAYYVSKDVDLMPAETRTFEVVINDIWTTPESQFTEWVTHVGKLAGALRGTEQAETAARMKGVLEEAIKGVQDRQASAAVGLVRPVEHIRAFEANQEALDRIRRDLGMLENLVIAAGKDPGTILGAPKAAPAADSERLRNSNDVVTIRIKVTNPSLTETRKIPLKREFPVEVKPADVVDAGGLQVGFDAAKGLTYAYLEDVELAPRESRTFEVTVRNPWSGQPGKLPLLQERLGQLMKITEGAPEHKAVRDRAQALLGSLAALKEQKAPAAMNEQYVAFARAQGEAVRDLEAGVMRLEELFQPREKPYRYGVPMMDVPRPDRRTTWVIIYIILGFLAAFSALFFLRWYGRSKAEKLGRSDAGREA
jgi:hypothetical protein